MLQTDYTRGTKDSDILETRDLTSDITTRLLQLAEKGTELHARHKLYVDIVASGVPFLPQVPIYHAPLELNGGLRHFEVRVLDVADVAVSKLKRFNANDSSDIQAMIRVGRLEHPVLVTRFGPPWTPSRTMRGPRIFLPTSPGCIVSNATCSGLRKRRSSCRRGQGESRSACSRTCGSTDDREVRA